MKNIQEKFDTVITKNTFYFYNREFEEAYEGYVNSIKETLLVLKNQIQNMGLRKELFEDLVHKKENGLRALLALTGFSNESLKRLITFIRIADDTELNALVYKEKWIMEAEIGDGEDVKEWSDSELPHPYGLGFLVHRFYQNLRRLSIRAVPALHTFYLKSHSQEKRIEPSSFTSKGFVGKPLPLVYENMYGLGGFKGFGLSSTLSRMGSSKEIKWGSGLKREI